MKEQRIPRPLGFTLAIKASNNNNLTKQEKQQEVDRIKKLLIDNYVTQGFQLNNTQMNLQELSNYVNLPMESILRLLGRNMSRLNDNLGGEQGAQLARVLNFQVLNFGLKIGTEAMAQLNVLKASQNGSYKAFLSSEVNKSIGNLVAAGKLQKDIADMFSNVAQLTKSGPNIAINNNLTATQSGQFLTTEKAIKLIQKEGTQSALESPSVIEDIEASYTTNPLPEVNAKFQDLTKIGIRHNGTQDAKQGTLLGQPNPNNEALPTDPKSHHEGRREQELGIVDEEDLVED